MQSGVTEVLSQVPQLVFQDTIVLVASPLFPVKWEMDNVLKNPSLEYFVKLSSYNQRSLD
jgi:hypothetical protein